MSTQSSSSESMITFTSTIFAHTTARLGTLIRHSFPSTPIPTPTYLASTSRGAIPHISPDTHAAHVCAAGVYVALEDFIERAPAATPPIYNIPPTPSSLNSRLRRFAALPNDRLVVLGARRANGTLLVKPNGEGSLSICTSVGYRQATLEEYVDSARLLRPDIFLAPVDVALERPWSVKRREQMGDRTAIWLTRTLDGVQTADRGVDGDGQDCGNIAVKRQRLPGVFAGVLPLDVLEQRMYLQEVVEVKDRIAGLAVHNAEALVDLPKELQELMRLSMDHPKGPIQILEQISRGIDLFTLSFIGEAADAGVALNFSFPISPHVQNGEDHYANGQERHPLGIDLWPTEIYATAMVPLEQGCQCHACQNYTQAYVNHLLNAKELSGWVLLQIHNHSVIDRFFAGVRESIHKGAFEADKARFEAYYEHIIPINEGRGPRLRGYQYKSERGQKKVNEKAWGRFEDQIDTSAVTINETVGGAKELIEDWLGEAKR